MARYVNDTITALATPAGIGALAVIRVTGEDLTQLITRLTGKKFLLPRQATLVDLKSLTTGEDLDQSLIIYFPCPNSYTGEDMIEISCHGGEYVPNAILATLIESGVRAANPGEFSFRAFMNGKMDLVQSEAVSALINAKTGLEAGANLKNIAGKLSSRINALHGQLIDVLSVIEHELDFTEDEITFSDRKNLLERLSFIEASLQNISTTASMGRTITNGVRLVLLGRPNTGKSSLFNTILGHERAIVSNIPGTTRDTLEAWFELKGIPVCLVDTAGFWESGDFLENLGMKKTIMEVQKSDFILFVDDINPVAQFSGLHLSIPHDRLIFILTKSDRANDLSAGENVFVTSSLKDEGIVKLITYISTLLETNEYTSEIQRGILLTRRQRSLVKMSISLINNIIDDMSQGQEMDVIASMMRQLSDNLSDIVGNITNTEVVKNIFSNFCVGK